MTYLEKIGSFALDVCLLLQILENANFKKLHLQTLKIHQSNIKYFGCATYVNDSKAENAVYRYIGGL